MLITADTVVTGRELLRPGWIDVDGRPGATRWVPVTRRGRPIVALGAVTVVPGFVDMHVHGGGGGAFPTATRPRSRPPPRRPSSCTAGTAPPR